MLKFLFKLLLQTVKNVWGSIQTPYVAYRKLLSEDPLQLAIVFSLIGLYFLLVVPIKFHTFHPFLLTINTSRLFSWALGSYLGICLFLYGVGKLFNVYPSWRAVMMCWGYSLIPTLFWFLGTSIFTLILPPPRTTSVQGTAVSLLYLAFSLSLFWWKGILYYLTLRFALKLDLQKIIIVSAFFLPLLAIYSVVLYKIGIFKIPFI